MVTAEKEVERLLREIIAVTVFRGKVFSVGGFVRDDVLGIPSKDLDIVVELEGGAERLAKYLHTMFPTQVSEAHQLGASYPIWHLRFKGNIQIDKRVFETEGASVDFADTQVEMFPDVTTRQRVCKFGSIAEDVLRRDFTTNMLLRDLTTGELRDLTGTSLQDIKDGVLRGHPAVSLDKIFADDPLRMIRLIRFHAKFGWTIPEDVLETVRRNASRISIISGERIHDELVKIMQYGKLAPAIRLMDSTGLLQHVMPEVDAMKGVEQDVYYHSEGDVFVHTLLLVEKAKPTVLAQISALLHDVGKPACREVFPQDGAPPRIKFLKHEDVGAEMAEVILRRLKFDLDVIGKVKKLIHFHLRAHFSPEWSSKAVRKFVRDCGDELEDILHLTEIDGLSSFGPDGNVKGNCIPELRERIATLSAVPIQKKTMLDGREVMALLQLHAGTDSEEGACWYCRILRMSLR
jgi:poly(A) polymerase